MEAGKSSDLAIVPTFGSLQENDRAARTTAAHQESDDQCVCRSLKDQSKPFAKTAVACARGKEFRPALCIPVLRGLLGLDAARTSTPGAGRPAAGTATGRARMPGWT